MSIKISEIMCMELCKCVLPIYFIQLKSEWKWDCVLIVEFHFVKLNLKLGGERVWGIYAKCVFCNEIRRRTLNEPLYICVFSFGLLYLMPISDGFDSTRQKNQHSTHTHTKYKIRTTQHKSSKKLYYKRNKNKMKWNMPFISTVAVGKMWFFFLALSLSLCIYIHLCAVFVCMKERVNGCWAEIFFRRRFSIAQNSLAKIMRLSFAVAANFKFCRMSHGDSMSLAKTHFASESSSSCILTPVVV